MPKGLLKKEFKKRGAKTEELLLKRRKRTSCSKAKDAPSTRAAGSLLSLLRVVIGIVSDIPHKTKAIAILMAQERLS